MTTLTDPSLGSLAIVRPLVTGRSFDLVVARDPETDDLVTVRAPRYRDPEDAGERADRLAGLELEVEAAAIASAFVGAPTTIWRVGDDAHAVAVHPFIDGRRLDAWLADEAPTGLPAERLLPIARDIATAVADLHEAGLVHGCLSPDHVLVTDEGIRLVGLGNVRRRGTLGTASKASFDDAYSAPEVLHERSGQFNTPRSDIYGFGMLLSFLATGQRPTGEVSAPLTRSANARLAEQPVGVALVVAKCIQPVQKKRLGPMRKVAAHLTADTLPAESTEGFGPLPLLAPWSAAGGAGLPVSHLSPGPLVDRPRAGAAAGAPPAADGPSATDADLAAPVPGGSRWLRIAVSAAVLALAAWIVVRQLAG